MKANPKKVQELIQKALYNCGDDATMSEVRKLLFTAKEKLSKLDKKKSFSEKMREEFEQKALNRNKEWWDKIKENISKFDIQGNNKNDQATTD